MPASSGTCGPNLGTDAGPELPEAAMWALESWKDGARSCSLEPLAVERTVYCFDCGYAGTLDLYARIKGVLINGPLPGSVPAERRLSPRGRARRTGVGRKAHRATAN